MHRLLKSLLCPTSKKESYPVLAGKIVSPIKEDKELPFWKKNKNPNTMEFCFKFLDLNASQPQPKIVG